MHHPLHSHYQYINKHSPFNTTNKQSVNVGVLYC